ncbi:MAG: hypothetical protein QOI38_2699 [Sphingomonadales bacterium]|jgi:hypothetical protein|nr:hypothetical protein [Sphingomonadales bacterium]
MKYFAPLLTVVTGVTWLLVLLITLLGGAGGIWWILFHEPGLAQKDIFPFAIHISTLVSTGAAIALIVRSRDRASVVLSFALLLIGSVSHPARRFWQYWEQPEINTTLLIAGLTSLALALLTYPDGKLASRRCRWLFYIALFGGLAAAASYHLPGTIALLAPPLLGIVLVVIFAAGILLVRRLQRGVEFEERQQLKWVAYPLALAPCLVAAAGALLALADSRIFADTIVFRAAAGTLFVIGFSIIPLGVLASASRWRLNDPDAYLTGISAYSVAGIAFTGLFALGSLLLSEQIKAGASPKVAIGINILISAILLPRIKDWTLKHLEKRLQPALVALRTLPADLERWQNDDDPARLAQAAADALAAGVRADWAVVAIVEGTERASGGHANLTVEEAQRTARGEPIAAADRGPPHLRHKLAVDGRSVGELILGRRSDGESYRRSERRVVESILPSLAMALSTTRRRRLRQAEVDTKLVELGSLLREIQERLDTGAERSLARE